MEYSYEVFCSGVLSRFCIVNISLQDFFLCINTNSCNFQKSIFSFGVMSVFISFNLQNSLLFSAFAAAINEISSSISIENKIGNEYSLKPYIFLVFVV